MDQDTARGIARDLAARVNCLTDSSELLKRCLQKKTAKELVLEAEKIRVRNRTRKLIDIDIDIERGGFLKLI